MTFNSEGGVALTQKQAEKTERMFNGGVKAGVWCYQGDGDWSIQIISGDANYVMYDLDSVNRLASGLRDAVAYVREHSTHSCWKPIPQNAAELLAEDTAAGESVKEPEEKK